jgi:hypothetical protein
VTGSSTYSDDDSAVDVDLPNIRRWSSAGLSRPAARQFIRAPFSPLLLSDEKMPRPVGRHLCLDVGARAGQWNPSSGTQKRPKRNGILPVASQREWPPDRHGLRRWPLSGAWRPRPSSC